MIYTVTCNPAIDYVVRLDHLVPDAINRVSQEDFYFGGKGINVSIVLHELGVRSVAMGFLGGWTGRALEEGLSAMEIRTDFVTLDDACGSTRINVKAGATEINGRGPRITEEALAALRTKVSALEDGDMLVISGSVPVPLPPDTYQNLLAELVGKSVRVVVDAEGDLLLSTLPHRPFLIKPNNLELGEMLGRRMETTEEIFDGAGELQTLGARNVLVSRGAEGAVLLTEEGEQIVQPAVWCVPVNPSGAGDSMLAGFIAGYLESRDCRYALRLGAAAGAASAGSPGLARKEQIEQLMK